MAKTKQFIVTVENRPGAVAEIARTLGNAKVNILALLGNARETSGTVQKGRKGWSSSPESNSPTTIRPFATSLAIS